MTPGGSNLFAFVAGALLVTLGGCSESGQTSGSPSTSKDTKISFELTDQRGRRTSEVDLAGRWSVFYFGFTSCPEVCPVAMTKLSRALSVLPSDVSSQIQPVFITVDPATDTPEVVGRFVSGFGPNIRGLTGTPSELESVRNQFGAYANAQPSGSGGFDHSTLYFLVNPHGAIDRRVSTQGTVAEIAAILTRAVRPAQ